MAFELPKLPYALDALVPHISKETLEYHYGKHHQAYVDKLNAGVEGTNYAKMSLEDLVRESVPEPKIFNNAAQAWNHAFYWDCLSPHGGGEPKGALADSIKKGFGGYAELHRRFTETAVGHFGSGWAWLVRKGDGTLAVTSTHDADNPLIEEQTPLLTCDVWEHAYYVDYRNARPRYLEAFWKLVNWEFVEKNLRG